MSEFTDIWTAFEECGGILTKPHGEAQMVKCIFHEDTLPSAKIYSSFEKLVCFACRFALTASQLRRKYRGERIEYESIDNSRFAIVDALELDLRSKLAFLRSNGQPVFVLKVYTLMDKMRILIKQGKELTDVKIWDNASIIHRLVNERYEKSKSKI